MTTDSDTCILVVEDDNTLLHGLCEILELAQYKVIAAANGVEALNALRRAPILPSVIVSDIGMPDMDGYEFLATVRRRVEWTEIPFIFLTARTQHQDQRQGMIAGADDYLVKPFRTPDLLNAIEAKLKRRSELATIRLDQIRRIKQDILTILSHEFRTPLTPIVAYSDMLVTDVEALSPNDLSAYVKAIRTGASRLQRLVEDLLLLVELEIGEAQNHFQYYAQKFDREGLTDL